MQLAKFRDELANGGLHEAYIEAGCQPVIKVIENVTVAYVKEAKKGESNGRTWVLSRIGITDDPRNPEETIFGSTFTSPLPPVGTTLATVTIEYEEYETNDGATKPSLRFTKLVPVTSLPKVNVVTNDAPQPIDSGREHAIRLANAKNAAAEVLKVVMRCVASPSIADVWKQYVELVESIYQLDVADEKGGAQPPPTRAAQ